MRGIIAVYIIKLLNLSSTIIMISSLLKKKREISWAFIYFI